MNENTKSNEAPKKAKNAPIQDAEVIQADDGTEKAVVVAEETEEKVGFFGKVGGVVKKVWKPVVIAAGAFVAGIATAAVLGGNEEESDDEYDEEDDEDESILDEI